MARTGWKLIVATAVVLAVAASGELAAAVSPFDGQYQVDLTGSILGRARDNAGSPSPIANRFGTLVVGGSISALGLGEVGSVDSGGATTFRMPFELNVTIPGLVQGASIGRQVFSFSGSFHGEGAAASAEGTWSVDGTGIAQGTLVTVTGGGTWSARRVGGPLELEAPPPTPTTPAPTLTADDASAAVSVRTVRFDDLAPGTEIEARSGEIVRMVSKDGSIMEMVGPRTGGTSTFVKDGPTKVHAISGRFRFDWSRARCRLTGSAKQCEVTTGEGGRRTSSGSIRGTEFLVDVDPDGTAIWRVLEGSVAVSDGLGRKTVLAGRFEEVSVPSGGVPSDPKPFDPQYLDRWWEQAGARGNRIPWLPIGAVAALAMATAAILVTWAIRRSRAVPSRLGPACARCGRPLRGGARFCTGCGAPVRVTAEPS